MTYAESAKMNGRDEEHLTYEHLNISQYADGSVLDCLRMETYTVKQIVARTFALPNVTEDVIADLQRGATTALTGVPAGGFECAAYPLEGDFESHTIYAETIEEAARYFIQWVTGKFNSDPMLKLFSGHKSMEAAYLEEEDKPLTAMVISIDRDDATTGYVVRKNPKTNCWSTKGVWMRQEPDSNKWRPLNAEEQPLIGQGKIWRMGTKWEKEISEKTAATK
jgi:hypothetical protein